MMTCYFLAQKIATDIKWLLELKSRFESYLTGKVLAESLTAKQIALIGKVLHSINQTLTDLESLKEALK